MGVPRKVVDARRPRASPTPASASAQPQTQKRWKGKKRDEGDGGKDGIVLSLNLVGDGTYTACVIVTSLHSTSFIIIFTFDFLLGLDLCLRLGNKAAASGGIVSDNAACPSDCWEQFKQPMLGLALCLLPPI